MIFTAPPCNNCPDRHFRCHSDCPKWIAWQSEEKQRWDAISFDLKTDRAFREASAERCARYFKQKQKDRARGR